MKWKKSLMSLALAGCMLAGSVPAVAFAANETVIEQTVNADTTTPGLYFTEEGEHSIYLANDGDKDNVLTSVDIEVLAVGLENTITAELDGEDVAEFDTTQHKETGDTTKKVTVSTTSGTGSVVFHVKAKQNVNSNGVVNVKITGKKSDGTTYPLTYKITVGEPKYLTKIEAANKPVEYDAELVKDDKQVIEPEITLNPSDTTQQPTKQADFKYTTSDNSVVKVVDGKTLKVVGRGTATITGSFTMKNSKGEDINWEFSFTVNVVDSQGKLLVVKSGDAKPDNDPTTVDKEENVYIGNTIALTAQYKANQSGATWETISDVTWSSSNPSVAKVENGIVTALTTGTASISATTAEGLIDSFTVNVKGEGIAATGVAFDQSTLTMTQGQRNEDIEIVTIPEGADVKDLEIVTSGENKDSNLNNVKVKGTVLTFDTNGIAKYPASGKPDLTLTTIVKDAKTVGLSITVAENATLGDYSIEAPVQYTNPHMETPSYGIAKCTVTVTSPDADAVTTFELQNEKDDESRKYEEAKEKTLTTNAVIPVIEAANATSGKHEGIADKMNIEPASLADQVTYSIDDTSVAKLVQVDGVWNVIALKPGSAVLTATVGNKTDTITLKVADPADAYKLADARLNNNSNLVAVNIESNKDIGIEVKFNGVNGDIWDDLITNGTKPNNVPNKEADGTDNKEKGVYSPVWSSADESIATVNKAGRITGVKAGTTTVTAILGSYTLKTTVIVVDPNAKPDDNKPGEDQPKPEAPKFSDVAEGAWYKDAVSAVAAEGWMDGTAKDIFEPETKLSRAMAAQILWAKNDKEYVAYDGKFTDVETNDWYANAVSWASSKGIVAGKSATIFDPKGDISRQDFALMLAKEEGATLPTDTTALDKYDDKADIATYAAPAFAWAVENKIISGVGKDAENARPTWSMTRAQAAQMFSHLIKTETPDEGGSTTPEETPSEGGSTEA